MSDSTITLLTLGAVVALFVWNRLPVELVAVGASLALFGLDVLSLDQALAGFSDPAVILIGALFVVSEGLDSTGVTTWVGQSLGSRAGSDTRRIMLTVMLIGAALTAFIGLNGSVAALLPMTVVMALRQSLPPSKLLMPLAFAGSAGGLLLLTGSPVNVVISEAADDAGVGRFGFVEFAAVGLPIVIGTLVLVLVLAPKILPTRSSRTAPPDLSGYARTLVQTYTLDNVAHLRVTEGSDFVGLDRTTRGLGGDEGLRIVTVLDAAGQAVSEGAFAAGDRITAVGDTGAVERFAAVHDLSIERVRSAADVQRSILSKDSGAAEVVIPPRSRLVDAEVQPSQVLAGGLIVLAVTRGGRDLGSLPVRLRTGDTLLLEGPWSALEAADDVHDVLVVDSPGMVRRQTVPLGKGSRLAIVTLLAMVVLLATGAVPSVIATLLAAGVMILGRVVTVEQAYRGISWTTLLLVAGMVPMSTAVSQSGAGEDVAGLIVDIVGDGSPTFLLAALFVITVAFSQMISNTATALIMIPVAISAAEQLDVSARPVLMSLCVGASVAFLTPVSTPANLMIMGPAGYRFGDYWKLGLPLTALFGVVAVFGVPLVWNF